MFQCDKCAKNRIVIKCIKCKKNILSDTNPSNIEYRDILYDKKCWDCTLPNFPSLLNKQSNICYGNDHIVSWFRDENNTLRGMRYHMRTLKDLCSLRFVQYAKSFDNYDENVINKLFKMTYNEKCWCKKINLDKMNFF